MGSDYEILTEKDMPYFRDLVDKGQAVIIEIPEDVLMDLDIGEFEEDKEASKITDEELLDYINKHKQSFIEAAERNEQIMERTRRLEEELMGTEDLPQIEEAVKDDIDVMPVAPLPSSISMENTEGSSTRAEREEPMRDEEWKKAGGPTSSEMLDTYEKEEEEQRLIRERRQRLRMQREARTRIENNENEEALAGKPSRREDPIRPEEPESSSGNDGSGKTPPTPEQLLEAKKKARQLGYTGNIPMEVLMMLLDVTDEEETKQEDKQEVPEKAATIEYKPSDDKTDKTLQLPKEEAGPIEETAETESASDAHYPAAEEPMKKAEDDMRMIHTDDTPEDRKEENPVSIKDNPYTGEDAELYRDVVESGQFSMEDINFVMSNQIPTDYKRQLFMKMLENKLDDEEE